MSQIQLELNGYKITELWKIKKNTQINEGVYSFNRHEGRSISYQTTV